MTGCINRTDENSNIITFVINNVIITILRHIKNPDIVQFIQAFSGPLRGIKAYSGITETCAAVIRHIRNSA